MWEEKEDGSNDESSYSKNKLKETQVSTTIKKHSRYIPPTNQVWEEKEEGSNDDSSYSKHKKRVTQVSIIKQKRSRYTPPTKQGWQERKRGIRMTAAIQNTK